MKSDSIIPWRRAGGAYHPLAAIDDLFKSFLDEPVGALHKLSGDAGFNPQFNIVEEEDAFIVSAEVPGVEESDLDISLDDEQLTISGHKKQDYDETKKGVHYVGRSYGSFTRVIPLAGVNRNEVDANLENGLLKINLPKSKEPEKRATKINIKK